jgi:serralysin
VWVVPNYGSSIAPWYPTISKLPTPDQVLTDPSYTAGYTRSFAAVGNTAGFTDTGLTVVSGAFQVRSNILIADAINTRSKVRLTTIPNDTVYLRAEYVNVWNNDGDPTYVGIGLCTSDGTSGYELESSSGGFVVREIKSGATTLSATASSQGDDLNRTYAVELDDGYINFYSKASGSSVYVLRSRMPNTIGSQLYPTYISETTSGGLGKGASALLFETAEAVGGSVVAPTYSGNFTATVAENTTAVGTYVASTTGGAAVTYSLTGADAARFNINSSTAVVTFASAPDFESPNDAGTNNVYNVNVVATNSAGSATATLTVTVTDAAENVPVTMAATYTPTIAENTSGVITTITPTAGTAPFVFSLTGADAARFNINSSTGVLSFVAPLDFEAPTDAGTNNVYNFNVVATNNGGANTASTAVTLTITDATDTAAGIIFTIRDSSTNGSPFLASGTSVTMTVYADGTPDIVEVYNGTIGANGSVTFTDNAWVVGANKVCVLEAGGIKQGGIPFQVVSIPV